MAKSKRSKACEFSQSVRDDIEERDQNTCVLCGIRQGAPNMHYIPRSDGGLGIEQNGACGCDTCHHEYDNGYNKDVNLRERHKKRFREYLMSQYDDWNEEDLYYNKWR
jgi:hypothetical protein